MTSLELLMKLSLTPGVSGFEEPIKRVMIELLQDVAPYQCDNLGSIAFKCQGSNTDPRIMVVGHQDEIGFIVTHIQKNGLLRFHNLGGWDWRTLLSSPVSVINENGEQIAGIIGSIPIHFRKDSLSEMKLTDMFIDIGASSEEEVTELFGIKIGAPIAPTTHFIYQEKTRKIFSKAFDDRVGIAIAIETAKFLADNPAPNTVFCCGSVQEEVGIRGAQTLSNMIRPDLAIVVEGVPADDFPGNEHLSQNLLGKGAHLRLFDPTIVMKPALYNMVIELAQKNNIPIQKSVRTSGGTDAKVIHLTGIGVPTVVVGVPVRYAHSHNGIISLDDYDNCLRLVKAIVSSVDSNTMKNIF